MPDVSYTIYRATQVHESGAEPGVLATALIRCGAQNANGPKRALSDWFDKLTLDQQVAMNGAAKFVVVPTGNHHELSPRVEAQPRLVF